MTGSFYVVGTPIGNLADITQRAIEILDTVDFIVCEDTRITSHLLKKYNIVAELISMNARSEDKKVSLIFNKLSLGKSGALVTDSGTPCISDPGVKLINHLIKNKVLVNTVPGPNAALAALSISGLPASEFTFLGFLPQKKGRQKKLKDISVEERTLVIYESTYRIEKLLTELTEYMPERLLFICRELTKKFEETWRGYPRELLDQIPSKTVKGEFVVVIAPVKWRE